MSKDIGKNGIFINYVNYANYLIKYANAGMETYLETLGRTYAFIIIMFPAFNKKYFRVFYLWLFPLTKRGE